MSGIAIKTSRLVLAAVAGLAAVIGLAFSPPQAPAEAQTDITYIRLVSEPGDLIGGGTTRHFTTGYGPITAEYTFDQWMYDGLYAQISTVDDGTWSFRFAAPQGDPIEIGPYEDAGMQWDGNPTLPRIAVDAPEGECSDRETVGWFEVLEFELDVWGEVDHLAVDFEAHCGSTDTPALYGEVRFHASSESYPSPPDSDGDGIPDTLDSCPLVASPVTTDADGDRIADPCDPDFTVTYLYMDMSNHSSYPDLFLRPSDALLAAEDPYEKGAMVLISYDLGPDTYSVRFSAPVGEVLAPGVYESVEYSSPSHELLHRSLPDGCSADVYGRFEIFELEIVDKDVTRFSADFEYGCNEGATDTYRGSVRVNASNIPVSVSGAASVDGSLTAGMLIEVIAPDTESVLGVTTSGSGGSFSVEIPPTPVQLRASATGAVLQYRGGHIFADLSRMVDVGFGVAGIDIDIQAGGAIAGRVLAVDGGQIFDTAVALYDESGIQRADHPEIFSGLASRVHYYEAIGMPPGDYRIVVHPWETSPSGMPYATGWYPDATYFYEAESVPLRAGEVSYADIEVGLAGILSVAPRTPDGSRLDYPYTEVFNPLDVTGIAGYRSLTGWTVTEGDWYVLGANYDEGDGIIWDYFPEWYLDAPELRLDLATPVAISAGERLTVEVELDPLFPDMFDTVFTEDIYWLRAAGITKGCEGGARFCTDGYVTRGEMAAFMSRAFALSSGGDIDFVDDDASIFEGDIEKLAAAGITRGCNPPVNDMFCPDAYVTRQQMAAFLVRALSLDHVSGFDFVDDDWSIFEEDIEALAAAGVTLGCNPPDNDRFCPTSRVTRGQMAAFLHRAFTTPVAAQEGSAARPIELGSFGTPTRSR